MMDMPKYTAFFSTLNNATVVLFTQVSTPSDYFGTAYIWQAAGTLDVDCQEITDQLTIEEYGKRIENMKTLYCNPTDPISDGMGISLDPTAIKPTHSVISAKPWKMRKKVLIEVIPGGN